MTSTWVVGDIHGCAAELGLLLEAIDLQPGDRFLSAGDLFHRGPDPVGVLRILQNLGSAFDMVLGNHEWALLNRFTAAANDGADLEKDDLHGDNQAKMDPSALPVTKELLAFLQNRPYFLRGKCTGAAWQDESHTQSPMQPQKNAPGQPRDWILVHGSVLPGRKVEDMQPAEIVRLSRCHDLPGAPLWHSAWQGPEFIVFGHAQSAAGLHASESGEPLAYGLDTGCVYGGPLTAIRLEDLTVVQQAAVG